MKKIIILSAFFGILGIAYSFKNESNKNYKLKGQWCYYIKCNGKSWHELSPTCFSSSEGLQIMKAKYPNCSVSYAADGHCK
ncbi:MAG: hypothetical protein ACKO6J_04420 [Crocinitomicaceae bacterium]|jgi:hypothetical protein